MNGKNYVLVDAQILPEVYSKVLLAKKMIATGEAASASEAAKLAGISRSAFYKYKEAIFEYNQINSAQTATIVASLLDSPGVLSRVISEFYNGGANILSINQSIPLDNVASVSMSVDTSALNLPLAQIISSVAEISGVKKVEQIK